MLRFFKDWKFRYGVIYIICLILIGNIISILGPLIPIKANEGGIKQTDFSVVFTFRGIGYVIGSILVAQLQKRYGAHGMIALASLCCSVLCFVNVYETSIIANIIQWFFIGMTCGFMEVLCQISIVMIFRQKINIWMQALHFGFGIGAFISPLMLSFIGNQTMTFIAVFALINSVIVYRQTSPKMQKQQNTLLPTNIPVKSFQQPPKNLIRFLYLYFFILVGVETAFGGWIPSFCALTGVANEQQAGVSSSLFWISITIGRMIAIPVATKYNGISQLRFLTYSVFIVLCFCMIAILSGSLHIAVYGGSVMFGLAVSAIYPLLITTPVQFGYYLSSANTATFAVMGSSGEAILPVLVGIVMQVFGPYVLFIFCFLIGAIMVGLFQLIMFYKPQLDCDSSTTQMSLLSH